MSKLSQNPAGQLENLFGKGEINCFLMAMTTASCTQQLQLSSMGFFFPLNFLLVETLYGGFYIVVKTFLFVGALLATTTFA